MRDNLRSDGTRRESAARVRTGAVLPLASSLALVCQLTHVTRRSYRNGGCACCARQSERSDPPARHVVAVRACCAARSGASRHALSVAGVPLGIKEAKAGEFGDSARTTLFCAGMSSTSAFAHVPPGGDGVLHLAQPRRAPRSSVCSPAALLDVSIEHCHAAGAHWRRFGVAASCAQCALHVSDLRFRRRSVRPGA